MSGASLRILIVDDDRDFADSLRDVFELAGHLPQVVYSGEDAVRRFADSHFDLSFLDVRLPGMNGVECLVELRKIRKNAQVYMMTGYSVEQLLDLAVANGARGILHKPLNVEELLNSLEAIKPTGVLIADDDPEFVAAVGEALEMSGYLVTTAATGQEALDRVGEGGIDVIILDLRLPLISGVEAYMEMKRRGIEIPTIIATAYAGEESAAMEKVRQFAVTGVLVKPFDPAELLEKINSLSQ